MDWQQRHDNDLPTRVRLLEAWRSQHEAWSAEQSDRLSVIWDWRSEVKPALKTTNRLLWMVLSLLVVNAGFSAYLVVFHH